MELQDITKKAVTISGDATFTEALTMMIEEQTNTLLVCNTEGMLVGAVSVSDLLDAIVPAYLEGDSIAAHFATPEMFDEAVRDAKDKLVESFMSTDIHSVRTNDGLMAVAATALGNESARIPVVDDEDRPVGIISRRGLKHILADFLGIADPS